MLQYWEIFSSYFRPLDLFGQKVELVYKKETFFKTLYGATFTLCIYAFLLLQIIEGYKEFMTRQNAAINLMEVEDLEAAKINFAKSNITLAFKLMDNRDNSDIDSNYFEIKAFYDQKLNNNSTIVKSSTEILLNNTCSITNFNNFKNLYKNFELNKAKCLKFNEQNPNILLFTDPDNFIESFLRFSIIQCNNNTNCADNNLIRDQFTNTSLYIYILHNYFDGMDIENPIKQRLSYLSWNFESYNIRRKDSLYLTSQTLIDYNNFIMNLQEPKPKQFIHYNERDVSRDFKVVSNELDNNLMDLNVKSHLIPIKITRKYKTFIDFLSAIGGLFNIFFLFGMFVFGYINKTMLDASLINDNFTITDNQNTNANNMHNNDSYLRKNTNFNDRDSSYFKSSPTEIERTLFDKSNINSFFRSPLLSREQDKYLHKFPAKELIDEMDELNYRSDNNIKDKSPKKHKYNNMNEEPVASNYVEEKFCAHSIDDEMSKRPFHPVNTKTENKSKPIKTHKHKNFYFKYRLSDLFLSLLFIQHKTLRRKNEIFNKLKRIIDSYLDIKNIISLEQEFKIVKTAIFDPVQIDIVNYYKKPVLQLDGQDVTMIYRKSIQDGELDNCDIDIKLEELNKRKANFIDKRLIEMTALKTDK